MQKFTLCVFLLSGFLSLQAQNIRFSYKVTNPTPTQSLLTVYVENIGVGTENVSSFQYGFYYQSSEATVQGYAPNATDNSMSASELNNCVDFSLAESLGWEPDGTGAILAVTPPAGLPSGYNRLFVGSLIDANATPECDPAGTEVGSTPIPIIALLLDNSVGSGIAVEDSAYMSGTDSQGTWEYANFCFEGNPIIVLGQRLQTLPITLVSFDAAKYNDRSSLLSWSTSTEMKSSHFIVQRSLDGKTWSNVGRVNAAGDSQMILNYNFLDENVYNGTDTRLSAHYRLLLVDLDGKSETSPMKSVVFGNATNANREVTIYPNPASEGIHVEWDVNNLDQPTALEFYDINGKLILTQQVEEKSTKEYIDFSKTTMQPGLYMLRVLNGNVPIDHKQVIVGK
jgi:hypothetical protein